MASFRNLSAIVATCLFSIGLAEASTLTTIYSVTGSSDGAYSQAALVNVGGTLYGTTVGGGAYSHGVVFQLDPATGAETVLYSFTGGSDGSGPNASLISIDDKLYGTTVVGGAYGNGTVFVLNPATGAETVLHSFSDGAYPHAALTRIGGQLFGTTSNGGIYGRGSVFALNLSSGAETSLYSFSGSDGEYPEASLVKVSGKLYGTTTRGGTNGNGILFELDPTTGLEKQLYSFNGGTDGSNPLAALINVGGILYGTTSGGGSYHFGTVFKFNPVTGVESVIYAFTDELDGMEPGAALIDVGGSLYGTTKSGAAANRGAIFKIDIKTGIETNLYSFANGLDGADPDAALINVSGVLYGTTSSGGTSGNGTVFALDLMTGTESVVHIFTGNDNGSQGNALTDVQGTLYLSSAVGGAGSLGDIVAINPSTAAATELFAFSDINTAANPMAALINVNGALYGTTENGGAYGTLFEFDTKTGTETLLNTFTGASGYLPEAAMIKVGGNLYGTTVLGGTFGNGTVFKLNPVTGSETVIHNFDPTASDGANPNAALINVGGLLYGTTAYYGASESGAVFTLNPTTHVEKVLYSFIGGADGSTPVAALINVGGTLYGTTVYGGGADNYGTVFSLSPMTGTEKVLHAFTGATDGSFPKAALIGIGNRLYGTTFLGGTDGYGTVFALNLMTGKKVVLYNFTGGADGAYPTALIKMRNTIYGTTSVGGATGRGTVFKLIP